MITKVQRFADGEYIITQGDIENKSFYLLLSGKAIATKPLNPGEDPTEVKTVS